MALWITIDRSQAYRSSIWLSNDLSVSPNQPLHGQSQWGQKGGGGAQPCVYEPMHPRRYKKVKLEMILMKLEHLLRSLIGTAFALAGWVLLKLGSYCIAVARELEE
jgi:hypothetical protein